MSVQKKRSRRAASRALMVVAVSAGLLSLPSTPAAPLTGEARTRLGPSTGPPGTSRPLMTPRAGIPRSERRVRARLRQVRAASFASFPPGYLPWPMLNHDRHRNGLSPETGPDDPSVLGAPWPYDTGAPSMSSPAIDADGTAYMGNEDGALHAVGADGKNRWVFHAGGGLDSPAIGRHVEGASTIFAAATDGTVYALSPSGGVRWSVNPAGTSMRSSPVVADLQPNSPLYRLYLGDEGGTLWAIFETSSSAAMVGWQASLGAPIQTSPVLSPGLDVVYATARDSLYCFNAMTGGPFGSSPFTVGRRATMTTPVVDPATGNVVFGTAGGDVVEVDPECHAPVWTTTLADPVVQPPALAPDGSLRVIAGDRLVALASDGTFLWDQSMPDRLGSAAPAVDAGGTTIVGSTGGWVSAVAANLLGSGDRLLWSVQVSQSGSAVGTPAIDFGGRIYVPDAGGILNVIDEVPAFQIAYHSDLRQPANMDVYSLRETYGMVDPSRNLRITKASSKQLQPTYSLDPHQMAWVTDEQGNRDVVLATGNGGGGRLASDSPRSTIAPVVPCCRTSVRTWR